MRIRARYLWLAALPAFAAALVLLILLPSAAANHGKSGNHAGKHAAKGTDGGENPADPYGPEQRGEKADLLATGDTQVPSGGVGIDLTLT